MASRSPRSFIIGVLVLCTTTLTFAGADASAAERDRDRDRDRETREVHDFRLSDGGRPLRELGTRDSAKAKHSRPTWFRKLSRHGFESEPMRSDDGLQLVLQRERHDGAELLTLRYPVATAGRLQTYAGVGLNRAVYFAAPADVPTLFDKRTRHRSIGGAAELGVDLRVSEHVRLNAELRWIEIDRDAIAIRTRQGLVAADPVSFGVSIGWRFR